MQISGLTEISDHFSKQLLDRRIDHDLARLEVGPKALRQWIDQLEPELIAIWLDSNGTPLLSNHAEPLAQPGIKALLSRYVNGGNFTLEKGITTSSRPLDRWGLAGQHLIYIQQFNFFEKWLEPLRQLYWLMVGIGGLMALMLSLYYRSRIQKPIDLIVRKNKHLTNCSEVQEAQIDPSLIGNNDLGEIMWSRNQVLEQMFVETTKNTNILNSLHDAIFVFWGRQKDSTCQLPRSGAATILRN